MKTAATHGAASKNGAAFVTKQIPAARHDYRLQASRQEGFTGPEQLAII